MLRKVVPLVIAVAILASLGVVGCAAPAASSPLIELVPQEVNLVAGIQISRILADEDIRTLYNEAPKEPDQSQTFEALLSVAEAMSGIDLKDFSEALVFGDVSSVDAGYFGVIVKGTFNGDQLIASIEEHTGVEFATLTYKGYEIYRDEQQNAIAFPYDDIFFSGTLDAVKDVIDVKEGKAGISGELYDTYTALGDAWVKAAVVVSEEMTTALLEEPVPSEFPINLELFGDIDIAGCAFNKVAETIAIQVALHFVTADSAETFEDLISGLIAMVRFMPDVPAEFADILDMIEVTTTDSVMTITLEATVAEISDLMETLASY